MEKKVYSDVMSQKKKIEGNVAEERQRENWRPISGYFDGWPKELISGKRTLKAKGKSRRKERRGQDKRSIFVVTSSGYQRKKSFTVPNRYN